MKKILPIILKITTEEEEDNKHNKSKLILKENVQQS